MHKILALLAVSTLTLATRAASAQSCATANECPPNLSCIGGVCQSAPLQPAPAPPPAPGVVYAPAPHYTYITPPPPPSDSNSVRHRPAHFEFGVHFAGIFIPGADSS